ncbi:MAG: methylglyoxal synthase [Bacteroidota bacterium]
MRPLRTIALIAHDGKKADMIAFAMQNHEALSRFNLVGTGTTGKLIEDKTGLPVHRVLSGPLGGDAQIASGVVTGDIHAVFFFVDPLDKHPHDPDIQTLMRACNVHNVPMATNVATANLILSARYVESREPAEKEPTS